MTDTRLTFLRSDRYRHGDTLLLDGSKFTFDKLPGSGLVHLDPVGPHASRVLTESGFVFAVAIGRIVKIADAPIIASARRPRGGACAHVEDIAPRLPGGADALAEEFA